ncbi:glycosyltransferase family 4 protein [Belliella marina]|uniref:Glycosyltransferase family 4 protein n=1 Tax=Belliella marina TaxID=1644146 RepID=A0ABW4VLR5_9BACT
MNDIHKTNQQKVLIKNIDYKPYINPEVDARYYLQLPPEKTIITMISPLKRDCGHCFFLEVARKIVEIYENAHFLIVHQEIDLDFQKEFNSIKTSYNLRGRFDIIKFKDEIPDILKASDIFVFPMAIENEFPQIILKAMATGLPVVSIKSNLFQKVILDQETGFLIDKNDVESAFQKISLLLENPDLTEKMGKSGQERVIQHFSR